MNEKLSPIEITDSFAIALLRGARIDGRYETLDETIIRLVTEHIKGQNQND